MCGVVPDVFSWTTLIQSFKVDYDGDGSLRAFTYMIVSGVSPNSHAQLAPFSSLFSALTNKHGLGGCRFTGLRKVIELSRERLTDRALNHHVTSAVLRALADVGSNSEVEAFWQRCSRDVSAAPKTVGLVPAPCISPILLNASAAEGDGPS